MPDSVYHVVANVDTEFDGVSQCLAHYLLPNGTPILFEPRVPFTAAPGEDAVTPRIPVCRDLTDCFTSIGILGRFRRCLEANEGAKSFRNGPIRDAYPVLVCKFAPDQVVIPSKDQVPDVDKTHELWLTVPSRPVSIELKWLDSRSIMWDGETNTRCRSMHFLSHGDMAGRRHPWLSGTGCILESSLMDDRWYESPYRTPMTEAERSNILVECSGGMTLTQARTRHHPHRSIREMAEALSDTHTTPLFYRCRVTLVVGFPHGNSADDLRLVVADRLRDAFGTAVRSQPDVDVADGGTVASVTLGAACAAASKDAAKRLMYGMAKDFARAMADLRADVRHVSISAVRDYARKI